MRLRPRGRSIRRRSVLIIPGDLCACHLAVGRFWVRNKVKRKIRLTGCKVEKGGRRAAPAEYITKISSSASGETRRAEKRRKNFRTWKPRRSMPSLPPSHPTCHRRTTFLVYRGARIKIRLLANNRTNYNFVCPRNRVRFHRNSRVYR